MPYLYIRKVTTCSGEGASEGGRERESVWIRVHAWACRCAGASPCLFVVSARIPVNLKSNKSRQPPKLCFWQTRTWQGALAEGLQGCASAAVNHTFSITIVHILRIFTIRQRDHRKSVSTHIPAHHSCVTCPPPAPVCCGIPSKIFCVYQRGRRAIKSQP